MISFTDLVGEYLARHAKQSRSYATHDHNTRILARFFGEKRVSKITYTDIQEFVAHRLAEGVSRATVNRQRACLSKMFSCAIDWGYLNGSNPVKRVKKFPEPQGRVRFLSEDEAAKLLKAATDHLKPILLTALHTGGRLSEILTLRWRDIDLERRIVYFDHAHTKSGKQREVPMSDEIHTMLTSHRETSKALCQHCDATPQNDHGDEPVFTFAGKAIGTVRTTFLTARIRAGLGREVTFHVLRHTFASWFMINGGDLFRLQRFLGHSSINITQRYAHMSPDFVTGGKAFIGPPRGGSSIKVH